MSKYWKYWIWYKTCSWDPPTNNIMSLLFWTASYVTAWPSEKMNKNRSATGIQGIKKLRLNQMTSQLYTVDFTETLACTVPQLPSIFKKMPMVALWHNANLSDYAHHTISAQKHQLDISFVDISFVDIAAFALLQAQNPQASSRPL